MLLEARKHPVLERLYAAYGRRILRRAFARVWMGGAAWPGGSAPSIAVLNHSAWWDPVLALFLSHDLFRRDGYGIMQGAQLERYPFFRRIGCFGATTNTLADARLVSDYATRVLRSGEGRTLWLFPQGDLLPARGPIHFRSGTARLAQANAGVPIVPIAVRFEFRGEQRPECVLRVGRATAAVPGERPALLTRRLEESLRAELAELDAALARPELTGYRPVLGGRGSLSTLYERSFGRLARRPPAERAAPATPLRSPLAGARGAPPDDQGGAARGSARHRSGAPRAD
jgi:hypothetical protein